MPRIPLRLLATLPTSVATHQWPIQLLLLPWNTPAYIDWMEFLQTADMSLHHFDFEDIYGGLYLVSIFTFSGL